MVAIIQHTVVEGNSMPAKYEIGQKIAIKSVSEKSLSLRDAALHKYSGLTGEITDYYWIRPPTGQLFYLYTVRISTSNKDIVLYEDEIEYIPSKKSSRRSFKVK